MFTIQGSVTTTEGLGPSHTSLTLPISFLLVSFINSFHKWLLCTTKLKSILDIKNTKIIKTR